MCTYVESVCVSWPFSQLPALSVAVLIGVTTVQALVTATELFRLMTEGGGSPLPTSGQIVVSTGGGGGQGGSNSNTLINT